MVSEPEAGLRPRASRLLTGVVLLVVGLAWLLILGSDFARIHFRLMPSYDVAFTFWLPIAVATGPIAMGLTWLGWRLVRSRR